MAYSIFPGMTPLLCIFSMFLFFEYGESLPARVNDGQQYERRLIGLQNLMARDTENERGQQGDNGGKNGDQPLTLDGLNDDLKSLRGMVQAVQARLVDIAYIQQDVLHRVGHLEHDVQEEHSHGHGRPITKEPATEKAMITTQKEMMTTQKEMMTTQKDMMTTQKDMTTMEKAMTTMEKAMTTERAMPSTEKAIMTTTEKMMTTQKAMPSTANAMMTTEKVMTTQKAMPSTAKEMMTTKKVMATQKAMPSTAKAMMTTEKVMTTEKAMPTDAAMTEKVMTTEKAIPSTAAMDTTEKVMNTQRATPSTEKVAMATEQMIEGMATTAGLSNDETRRRGARATEPATFNVASLEHQMGEEKFEKMREELNRYHDVWFPGKGRANKPNKKRGKPGKRLIGIV